MERRKSAKSHNKKRLRGKAGLIGMYLRISETGIKINTFTRKTNARLLPVAESSITPDQGRAASVECSHDLAIIVCLHVWEIIREKNK